MPSFIIEARVRIEARDLHEAQLGSDALTEFLCTSDDVIEVLRCRVDTSTAGSHDLAALLNRAAAALETPADLTAEDVRCLIEDLTTTAGEG